jgi:hypothetical protein
VFESVDTRRYVLLLIELGVLADAAMAVGRGLVSWETAVDDAFAIQTCNVCNAGNRRAVLAHRRVGRERNSAATTWGTSKENAVSITETNTRSVGGGLDGHVQLSRSRAVLTHSHARGPPPYTPQAAHPGPFSKQVPLPTHRFFLSAWTWAEGHRPLVWHWPLQRTDGGAHTHAGGLLSKEAVNPSLQVNPQLGWSLMQAGAGVLFSGKTQFDWAA